MIESEDWLFKKIINDGQCHYVHGNPKGGGWHYCGQPCCDGQMTNMYCAEHYRACYVTTDVLVGVINKSAIKGMRQ